MSDTSANHIWQYGIAADRIAFTPNPAAGSLILYAWYDTTDLQFYVWDGSTWVSQNSPGGSAIYELTGEVIAGPGTGSQVAALSTTGVVAGVYTNTDLTVDSKGRITAAASGSSAGSGITSLTGDVTGAGPGATATTIANDAVTYAKIQNVSAASRILGRGSASGSGDVQELTLGSNLTLVGTVLDSSAPGTGTVTTTGSPSTGELAKFTGATSISNISADDASTILDTATDPFLRESAQPIHTVGFAFIATGVSTPIQCPVAGTIVGWAVLGDASGTVSIDVYMDTSSAPPSAPTVPTTKISASAPAATSSAQTAAGGTSAVSTWTTSVAKWNTFKFDVTSFSGFTKGVVEVYIQPS